MCDPSIMAIASMASGVADFMGQQNAQAKQKASYDEWFLQQEKNRKEQNEKQEASRKLAEAARDQALQQAGAEGQMKAQSVEEDRLTNALMQQGSTLTSAPPAGDPVAGEDTSIADQYLLSGQQSGDDVFKSDLAAGINQASRDARNRIASLADVQSRRGSSGGLDRYVKNIFRKSGEGIDEQNQYRVGNLAVYGVQQDVDPVQWSYTPGLRIG